MEAALIQKLLVAANTRAGCPANSRGPYDRTRTAMATGTESEETEK
jgi:hypothetical protein